MDEPSAANGWQSAHAELLLQSFRHYLGRDLLHPGPPEEVARRLFHAPFAVLSHDGAADPVLDYVNRRVMALWESDWPTLTVMPSRLTAEPMHREARARFLQKTAESGYITGYSGVRISTTGRRFQIEDAVVWTVRTPDGAGSGQAATFAKVRGVDELTGT